MNRVKNTFCAEDSSLICNLGHFDTSNDFETSQCFSREETILFSKNTPTFNVLTKHSAAIVFDETNDMPE